MEALHATLVLSAKLAAGRRLVLDRFNRYLGFSKGASVESGAVLDSVDVNRSAAMEEREPDRSESHLGPSTQYPLNCWWVVARTDEISSAPLTRTVLQRRVALFRVSDGTAHAFMDRCPHRWAPISRGKVIKDEIFCAYHGFGYNTKGECTVVPSQKRAPAALRIRTYPLVERGPFVWLWMGNPEKADPGLLPTISLQDDSSERVRVTGYRITNCGYSLIHENLADTEHVFYLHGDSLAGSLRRDFRSRAHGVMDIEPSKITFASASRNMPATTVDRVLFEVEDNQGFDSSVTSVFTAPGCFSSEQKTTRRVPREGFPDTVKVRYLWCSTPISADSCHFWWDLTFFGAACGQKPIEDIWSRAIEEDIDIVEGIQCSINSSFEYGSTTDALVTADRAVAAVRKLLKKMT